MSADFWVDHNGKCPARKQTLTDFLLARIKEDEHSGLFRGHSEVLLARVLSDCDAKRRIVEDAEECYAAADERGDAFESGIAAGHSMALRNLAVVYADHPDYREEWKP